jgi:CubicO group peptidase (beta-lactamase class C family)
MKTSFWILALLFATNAMAADPNKSLPRSQPESQGVSSTAMLDFIESADKQIASMHSFMLVRHGNVVVEGWWTPYNPDSRHELYSLSKSFTSSAIGMAVTEGKLSLDDKVSKFFPDDVPQDASEQLQAMRVRDLLAMATGHESEPKVGPTEVWTKTFLKHKVAKQPGEHFLYNTPATYMLSAILQKQTGQTALEYLKPRLFEPLGIVEPTWGTSPQGVSLGGYGLSVRTEDIAKFGQLYLQGGKWNEKPVLSSDWIQMATSKQVSNGSDPKSDWNQGYGFQFWRCRHNCFRGDGAFGQYCIVMPEQDAVIAITSGVKDMQAVLNLVWDKLLPALDAKTLPANPEATEKLQSKLSALVLPLQAGKPTSPMAETLVNKTFYFEKNNQELESVRLETAADGIVSVTLKTAGNEQRLVCSNTEWAKNRLSLGNWPKQPVATCGAWTFDDTFTLKTCLYETPFCLTSKLQFQGDTLLFDSESNVGFGQTKRDQLVGKVR